MKWQVWGRKTMYIYTFIYIIESALDGSETICLLAMLAPSVEVAVVTGVGTIFYQLMFCLHLPGPTTTHH